jgi:TRAP-type C4-dicarboxylate transport system permease small subunit
VSAALAGTFARTLRIAVAAVRKVATVVATLTFAGVVIAFAYTVFSRYVLHNPSSVADEIAIVLYLWTIMIGGSLAVSLDDQISFELLVDRLRGRGGRWVEAIGMFIAGAILLYALPTTADYVRFLWREKTAALEFPLDKVYACFVLFQGATSIALLARAVDLAFGFSRRKDASDKAGAS